MKQLPGILISHDQSFLQTIRNAASNSGVSFDEFDSMPEFISNLQDNGHAVIIYNVTDFYQDDLKWVQIINRFRPKVPLIVVSHELNGVSGGEIYDAGGFNLIQLPIDDKYLEEILTSAVRLNEQQTA